MLKNTLKSKHFWLFFSLLFLLIIVFFTLPELFSSATSYNKNNQIAEVVQPEVKPEPVIPPLDTVAYEQKLVAIANNPIPKVVIPKKDKNGKEIPIPVVVPKSLLWPVKTAYPNPGAILPFSRIVAYYGNLYSKGMGVLGEYPEDVMLQKLQAEVKKWQDADPTTPVIPALHYIAVVAQGSPGDSGKYRLRMPDSEIDKVLAMAAKINAIVFLDVQVGFSNVQTEVPLLEKYLKMPQVHLAIDPEFSMKGKYPPGKVVGTLDASDINFASNYLANLVRENNLTPKILIIHRYTERMVTNYKDIKTLPEVQIVMNMDGWGDQAHKISTYQYFIYKEPVQFTGFKLFYKNDILTKGTTLMTPESLLKLTPQPVYIQYQ